MFRTCGITVPAKADFVPYRDYIGSALEILDVADGQRDSRAPLRRLFPGAQLDDRRHGSLMYAQEGRLYRFDLATRTPTLIDTGFATQQQQRPRAVVRRQDAGHQPPERRGQRRVDRLHGAGERRHADAHHARGPSYLHGWSPDGKWLVSTPAGATASSTSTRSRRRAARRRASRSPTGLDDGPEYHAGRRVHLLQLGAQRADADLADAARRQRPASRSRTTSSTTGSRTSRPTGSGSRSSRFPPDIARRRSSVLQAGLPAADAGRRRTGARDRVRLRRPGHDQRSVVVARRPAAGVREQLGSKREPYHGMKPAARHTDGGS